VNVDAALSRLGLTRLRLGSFGIMPPPPGVMPRQEPPVEALEDWAAELADGSPDIKIIRVIERGANGCL
jgi:hypothetical protein